MHALKLAPDKSSINTSSCSEDTAKEQSALEPEDTPRDQRGEDQEEAGAESGSVEEEAVNNCDEKNDEKSITADVEKISSAGIYFFLRCNKRNGKQSGF